MIVLYIMLTGPSILVAKETRTRLRNLRSGVSALLFLPLTATSLVLYAIFANDFVSQIPLLNLTNEQLLDGRIPDQLEGRWREESRVSCVHGSRVRGFPYEVDTRADLTTAAEGMIVIEPHPVVER